MLQLSRTLDHVGLFSRTWKTWRCSRASSRATTRSIPTRGRARGSRSCRTLAEEPPVEPMLAFIKTPHWERTDADTKEAFAELARRSAKLHGRDRAAVLGGGGMGLASHDPRSEMAANFEREWRTAADQAAPGSLRRRASRPECAHPLEVRRHLGFEDRAMPSHPSAAEDCSSDLFHALAERRGELGERFFVSRRCAPSAAS